MKPHRLFLVHAIFRLIPPTRGFQLKSLLLKWAGARIGSNVRISSSCSFQLTGDLEIGSNTWLGHELLIIGGDASVAIGQNVDIGPRVTIVTGTHEKTDSRVKAAGKGISNPVRIGDGSWIGACSTILGGVEISEAATIGAGSLVRGHVGPRETWAGVPARRLISIPDPKAIEKHPTHE